MALEKRLRLIRYTSSWVSVVGTTDSITVAQHTVTQQFAGATYADMSQDGAGSSTT